MSCDKCPFREQKKVFGEGSRSIGKSEKDEGPYDVVCVAMAPAKEELRLNRILVGVSGQILRGTLHQLGITEYYLTNVLLCSITTEDTSIIKAAVECCFDRLIEEIKGRKPKLTIALGDLPLHTLVDTKYSIREIEGRVVPSKVGALLPVTHPAYYWRRPEDAMDFIECMRAGVRMLNGRYHQASDVTLIVVTEDNLEEVLKELNKYEYLSVDTETSGFDAYGIHPNRILELGISPSNNLTYIITHDLITKFKDLLETKKLILWAARFDYGFLRQMGINSNIYFDGMLAHYCLDERSHSHGLKKVARIYLGSEDWERDIGQYLPNKKTSSYELIPENVRHKYLSKDAAYTYQLWEVLEEEVKDNWPFWNILMPATRMFSEIEYRGIRIDGEKILKTYEWVEEEVSKAEKELWELVGKPFNPKSPKQVAEIIYGQLGIPINPKYGPSTNKHLLESYRDEYEIVDKIVLYREMCHDRDTYLAGFAKRLDNNFHVHPTFKLFGQVTGRISTENPAMMNIKVDSKIKELFIPENGRLIAEFDLKGADLRWYCIYSGDKVLKDLFLRGIDPHSEICKVAYGDAEESYKKRIIVKSMVFGRLYGRGRASFIEGGQRARRGVMEVGVLEQEVDHLIKTIDEMLPGLKEYNRWAIKQVHTKGYVESFFGRRRRFPMIMEANRAEVERQAANMPIQSATSDLNLLCMLHLWSLRKKYDIYPLFPVHDSIIVDVPNKEVVPILKKEIEDKAFEIVKGAMPFPVEANWGLDWSLRKE